MHDELNSLAQVQGQMVSADRTSRRQLHIFCRRRETEIELCAWLGIPSAFVDLSVCLPAKQTVNSPWQDWGPWDNGNTTLATEILPSSSTAQWWSGHLDTVILMLSQTNTEVWCGNCRPVQSEWSVTDKRRCRPMWQTPKQGQEDRWILLQKQCFTATVAIHL